MCKHIDAFAMVCAYISTRKLGNIYDEVVEFSSYFCVIVLSWK